MFFKVKNQLKTFSKTLLASKMFHIPWKIIVSMKNGFYLTLISEANQSYIKKFVFEKSVNWYLIL